VDDDPAIMRLFGWPFDTTQAFLRLVVSGTMERFPTLKIVTHHLGGRMMPFYGNRFLIKLANLKKNLQRPSPSPAAMPSSVRSACFSVRTTPSPRSRESGT
jgi:predicted TIM-barrel fold metal-dependent hydrolase